MLAKGHQTHHIADSNMQHQPHDQLSVLELQVGENDEAQSRGHIRSHGLEMPMPDNTHYYIPVHKIVCHTSAAHSVMAAVMGICHNQSFSLTETKFQL